MPDEPAAAPANREHATRIVAAYVRGTKVASDQLASLIVTVHRTLTGLGGPPVEATGERAPAVPVRRSVHRDFVVCLDCGWRGRVLRGHINSAHALSVDAYRARWYLSRDHALIAPAYSERRSTMAKQFGLGRLGRGAGVPGGAPKTVAPASPPIAPQPRRRGRPRSTSTPAENVETLKSITRHAPKSKERPRLDRLGAN